MLNGGGLMVSEDRDLCVNKFILFYSLKYLWKYYGHSVPELYDTMKICGVNKTMFERVLRLDIVDTEKNAKSYRELTGLEADYWMGIEQLKTGTLNRIDWEEFIKAREARSRQRKKGAVSADTINMLRRLEAKVDRELEDCLCSLDRQHTSFKTIELFARNMRKGQTITISARIDGIISDMENIGKKELMGLSNEKLKEYITKLQRYVKIADAVYTIKNL